MTISINGTVVNQNGYYLDQITTGIESVSEQMEMTVSPNPFSSKVTVRSSKDLNNVVFTISDLQGRTIAEIKNINGNTITLYRNHLPAGAYFICLRQKEKIIARKQLIITDG